MQEQLHWFDILSSVWREAQASDRDWFEFN
jgi:hypothetical protein